MRKSFFKLLISIIVILWIIYFLQIYFTKINEGFTPKINSLYRPYIRNINKVYENFINNYGPNVIINKFKKWDIY